MKHSLEYMSKSALRKMHHISVDGLYWANRQIRLAQKTGDLAKLREGLTGKKYYERNIAEIVDELQRRRGVRF